MLTFKLKFENKPEKKRIFALQPTGYVRFKDSIPRLKGP